MELVVLDSSALLAVLQNEVGGDLVVSILQNALMSTVNAAEVQAKLIKRGDSQDAAWFSIISGVHRLISFDEDQAKLCGELIASSKHLGLSAGDRACLALAISLNLPVYTADRIWQRMSVGVEVRLIR